MPKQVCIYHSADFDGICSGAIVRHFNPDVELVGYNYGEAFPWAKIPGNDIVMVDLTLPPAEMQRICDEADHFAWIDHHKDAIQAVLDAEVGPIYSNCRTDSAACELTWEYFSPDGGMSMAPLAVHYMGRNDMGDHEGEPSARAFHLGALALVDGIEDTAMWNKLLHHQDSHQEACKILQRGQMLLDAEHLHNKRYAEACAFETSVDGLTVIAINRAMGGPELFESVWNPDLYDAMCRFAYDRAGFWRVSLYSPHEYIDCAKHSRARGGNGHKKAAGFECQVLPWEEKDAIAPTLSLTATALCRAPASLEHSVEEAVALAARLNGNVRLDYNGVSFLCCPGDSPKDKLKEFEVALSAYRTNSTS